jgi:hypothetical protein
MVASNELTSIGPLVCMPDLDQICSSAGRHAFAGTFQAQGNEFRLTRGIFIRLDRICYRLGYLVRRQMWKKLHAIRVHRRWDST